MATSAKSDRERLTELVRQNKPADLAKLPVDLVNRINAWKWGHTGWVSPANLIVTAAWRKAFYPDNDCCKIWAEDTKKNAIAGGFSIRSADESVTVPVLAQFDLCRGFCSSNSGMQGSRAIEKSRDFRRIDRNMPPPQKTNFDFSLFANILNDINELDDEGSLEAIRMLINLSYSIRDARREQNAAIRESTELRIDLALIASEVSDPEFVKCVAAACLALIYQIEGLSIEGIGDHMTAADTRAEKPGDLTLVHHDQPVAAAEIKDKTRSLDWQDFQTALEICERFPTLSSYFFIVESDQASRDDRVTEMLNHYGHRFQGQTEIAVVTLQDLIALAAASASYDDIVTLVATNLTLAPSIKIETREAWLRQATSRGVAKG